MKDTEFKNATFYQFITGFCLTLVCLWDHYALNVTGWEYYYPFKITVIGCFFLAAYLTHKRIISPVLSFELLVINITIYGFIGTLFLHPTYLFTFYQCLAANSLMNSAPLKRFSLLTTFIFVLSFASISFMPEPDFMKEGFSIKPHLHAFTFLFGVITTVIYWFFNRQRNIINTMNDKFSLIGKQSSFLLHELKSPLARLASTRDKVQDRDTDYILSIINGIESLVTSPVGFKHNFRPFEWRSIQEYLESEFKELCSQLNISFEINDFDGTNDGQITTLKLAIRNLVKNAIEAIRETNDSGKIVIEKNGQTIKVSNSCSKRSLNSNKFFSPFYSSKDSPENFGIGLHFVEYIIEAHEGKISVETDDKWTTFYLKFK